MKTLILNLTLALGLAATAAGCGGSDSHCDNLVKKICDGKGDDYCKKTKAWLDKEFEGPNGEKLTQEESSAVCKMIVDDSDALAAYRSQANREVTGQN